MRKTIRQRELDDARQREREARLEVAVSKARFCHDWEVEKLAEELYPGDSSNKEYFAIVAGRARDALRSKARKSTQGVTIISTGTTAYYPNGYITPPPAYTIYPPENGDLEKRLINHVMQRAIDTPLTDEEQIKLEDSLSKEAVSKQKDVDNDVTDLLRRGWMVSQDSGSRMYKFSYHGHSFTVGYDSMIFYAGQGLPFVRKNMERIEQQVREET